MLDITDRMIVLCLLVWSFSGATVYMPPSEMADASTLAEHYLVGATL